MFKNSNFRQSATLHKNKVMQKLRFYPAQKKIDKKPRDPWGCKNQNQLK